MEGQQYYDDQYLLDINTRLRDIEEKQKLLRDRVLLLSQTLIEEREKTFQETQQMKKIISLVNEENSRIRELLQRITEQLGNVTRKDEIIILQRQLDLLRK